MMRNHRLQMATEAPALVEQGRVYKALKVRAGAVRAQLDVGLLRRELGPAAQGTM